MPIYPEHKRLEAIHHFSQKIHYFIEWLEEQGISMVKEHSHTDGCKDDRSGRYACGYSDGEYTPLRETQEKLIARFFEIDLKKLEEEKVAMLDECREANANKEGKPFVKVTVNNERKTYAAPETMA